MHVGFLLSLLTFCTGDTNFLLNKENDDCLPQMTDVCFHAYLEEVSKVRLNTTDKAIIELCSDTLDRINCAQEVINNDDCNDIKEKSDFDKWMEGLTVVYKYLCEYSTQSMKALWQTSQHGVPCWDIDKYITCVEHKTKITHIVDMLHVRMDINECNWILIAMSSCSSKYTETNEECIITENVLDELLHLFVQQSKCSCLKSSAMMMNAPLNSINIVIVLSWFFYTNVATNMH